MYTKDKVNRITLRLNEQQFEFVKRSADLLGVSPSDFLRMVVNMSMASSKMADEQISEIKTEEVADALKEGLRRENEKTDIND